MLENLSLSEIIQLPSIKDSKNLKYYELKHYAGQRKGHRKYELDSMVMDFIISKKLFHEKYPSTSKKNDLRDKIIVLTALKRMQYKKK